MFAADRKKKGDGNIILHLNMMPEQSHVGGRKSSSSSSSPRPSLPSLSLDFDTRFSLTAKSKVSDYRVAMLVKRIILANVS